MLRDGALLVNGDEHRRWRRISQQAQSPRSRRPTRPAGSGRHMEKAHGSRFQDPPAGPEGGRRRSSSGSAALPVANVSDSMSRMTAGGTSLRPMHAGGTVLAGPALTVKSRPGDNLMLHKALDLAEAGRRGRRRRGRRSDQLADGRAHARLRREEGGGRDRPLRRHPRQRLHARQPVSRSSRPGSPIAARTRTGPARSTCRSRSRGW